MIRQTCNRTPWKMKFANMISPIEASTLFATLVGLICNWKQERGSQATDRYQDFMLWLSHHHHDNLRERIFESDELQRELIRSLIIFEKTWLQINHNRSICGCQPTTIATHDTPSPLWSIRQRPENCRRNDAAQFLPRSRHRCEQLEQNRAKRACSARR